MSNAIDIVKRTLQINESIQNSALERLKNINSMAKEVNTYVTAGDQSRLDDLKRMHSEYEARMGIIDQFEKVDAFSISDEERVSIEDAKRYHIDRVIALGISDGNPLKASMMPVRTENEAKVKQTNLDYVMSVAEGYGVPADTREYLREVAYNNQQEFSGGGYKFETGYDFIPVRMQGYLTGKFKDYVKSNDDEDVDVVVSQNVQKESLTFSGLARNKFTELARNESMSTFQRMKAALDYAFERIGTIAGKEGVDASNSTIAEYFVTRAMESITDYRKSEGIRTMAEFDGYRAQNLIKARDGLNRIGSQLVSLSPEDLVAKMNNSSGFRDAMILAEVYGSIDEGGFYKNLSKRIESINPLIANESVSMAERMDLVRKNVLDVLAGEVARQRLPQHERLEAMKIIDRIDSQIDNSYGSMDPDVRYMIEAISTKWLNGFSGYALENADYIQRAEEAGRKTFQDMGGKMYAIDGDVADSDVEYLKNSYALPFVKVLAGDKNGNLMVGGGNHDFYFGNGGSAGFIKMYDAVMMNKALDDEDGSFPVFRTEGGKAALEAIMNNIVKASTTEGGKSYISDMFKPAGKGNQITVSGIGEGMKTFSIGKKEYYLPPAVIDAVGMGASGNSGNLINKTLETGNIKEALAGILHVYQDSVQNASEFIQDNVVDGYRSLYPNVKDSGNVYNESITRNIIASEFEMLDRSDISFVFSDSFEYSDLKDYHIDKIKKHREGLSKRIESIKTINEWGEKKFGQNTVASLSNSPVSSVIDQGNIALNVMLQLRDIEKRIIGLGTSTTPSSGDFALFGAQGASDIAEARNRERIKLVSEARKLSGILNFAIYGE